jgi:hypothetical protein
VHWQAGAEAPASEQGAEAPARRLLHHAPPPLTGELAGQLYEEMRSTGVTPTTSTMNTLLAVSPDQLHLGPIETLLNPYRIVRSLIEPN